MQLIELKKLISEVPEIYDNIEVFTEWCDCWGDVHCITIGNKEILINRSGNFESEQYNTLILENNLLPTTTNEA